MSTAAVKERPPLHAFSIDRCRRRESHSLFSLAIELRWLTDKLRLQWSKKCQARGIIMS